MLIGALIGLTVGLICSFLMVSSLYAKARRYNENHMFRAFGRAKVNINYFTFVLFLAVTTTIGAIVGYVI